MIKIKACEAMPRHKDYNPTSSDEACIGVGSTLEMRTLTPRNLQTVAWSFVIVFCYFSGFANNHSKGFSLCVLNM